MVLLSKNPIFLDPNYFFQLFLFNYGYLRSFQHYKELKNPKKIHFFSTDNCCLVIRYCLLLSKTCFKLSGILEN